jgi:hypothetical protein
MMAYINWPSTSLGQRAAVILTGHTIKKVEEWVFDWLLFGTVVWYCTAEFGVVKGGFLSLAIMAPFSASMCLLYIKLYDVLKIDCFGFEQIKEFKEKYEGAGWKKRMLRALLRKGDAVALIILSILADPFLATVYMRRGAFNGLSPRDRKIFWTSVVITNTYWTIRMVATVEILTWIFSLLPRSWQAPILSLIDWISRSLP